MKASLLASGDRAYNTKMKPSSPKGASILFIIYFAFFYLTGFILNKPQGCTGLDQSICIPFWGLVSLAWTWTFPIVGFLVATNFFIKDLRKEGVKENTKRILKESAVTFMVLALAVAFVLWQGEQSSERVLGAPLYLVLYSFLGTALFYTLRVVPLSFKHKVSEKPN
jgi:hypothetical protein